MRSSSALRGLHWTTILLAALSLSIGWGIRGNFGHEYGAMIPGALTAIAVCLMSGRRDWRARVPYFAMSGALGWAFGGSISYMQVISYTHSGHASSQFYGFFCLFVIGFLWAGLGGAGTAFPAVADRERLTGVIVPLCWIFAVWFVLTAFVLPWYEQWESAYMQTWRRHESPLYWFDADWLQASTAILALFLFDLWDRRFKAVHWLVVLGVGGAAAGWMLQQIIRMAGLNGLVAGLFVHPQGDLAHMAQVAQERGVPYEEVIEGLLINWPQGFLLIPQHLGWIFGLIIGISLYFLFFGQFRSGASLFLYMAVGWLVCFIIFPTLLNFGGAGFRMTPPRGDDWAGILGVYLGACLWLYRNKMTPVIYSSLVCAIIGGLGFSGAAWIKLLLLAPGNPAIVADPAVVESWKHWHSANWHSILEQTYGFINGIGVAVAMGLLARRTGEVQGDAGQRRWTEVFAVSFVLFLVTFLNIRKNVPHWVNAKAVPAVMKAPLFASIELSAMTWFVLVWVLMSATGIYLLVRHFRRPLACMPESWVGKGQMLYLVFLWMVVVANFERALPQFSEGRIITEGVIFVNAVLVTWMILVWPGPTADKPDNEISDMRPAFIRILVAGLVAVASTGLMTVTVRAVYGDNHAGHSGMHKRFGPDATWRIAPLEKGKQHS